jgi:hypothetical protein
MCVCVIKRGHLEVPGTNPIQEPTLLFVASNHCVVQIWGGNACSWYLIFDTLEPAGIKEPYNEDCIYIFESLYVLI